VTPHQLRRNMLLDAAEYTEMGSKFYWQYQRVALIPFSGVLFSLWLSILTPFPLCLIQTAIATGMVFQMLYLQRRSREAIRDCMKRRQEILDDISRLRL
jgi:hypothetical protein